MITLRHLPAGTPYVQALQTLRRRANLLAGEIGNVTQLHLAVFSGIGDVTEDVENEGERGGVLVFRGAELM